MINTKDLTTEKSNQKIHKSLEKEELHMPETLINSCVIENKGTEKIEEKNNYIHKITRTSYMDVTKNDIKNYIVNGENNKHESYNYEVDPVRLYKAEDIFMKLDSKRLIILFGEPKSGKTHTTSKYLAEKYAEGIPVIMTTNSKTCLHNMYREFANAFNKLKKDKKTDKELLPMESFCYTFYQFGENKNIDLAKNIPNNAIIFADECGWLDHSNSAGTTLLNIWKFKKNCKIIMSGDIKQSAGSEWFNTVCASASNMFETVLLSRDPFYAAYLKYNEWNHYWNSYWKFYFEGVDNEDLPYIIRLETSPNPLHTRFNKGYEEHIKDYWPIQHTNWTFLFVGEEVMLKFANQQNEEIIRRYTKHYRKFTKQPHIYSTKRTRYQAFGPLYPNMEFRMYKDDYGDNPRFSLNDILQIISIEKDGKSMTCENTRTKKKVIIHKKEYDAIRPKNCFTISEFQGKRTTDPVCVIVRQGSLGADDQFTANTRAEGDLWYVVLKLSEADRVLSVDEAAKYLNIVHDKPMLKDKISHDPFKCDAIINAWRATAGIEEYQNEQGASNSVFSHIKDTWEMCDQDILQHIANYRETNETYKRLQAKMHEVEERKEAFITKVQNAYTIGTLTGKTPNAEDSSSKNMRSEQARTINTKEKENERCYVSITGRIQSVADVESRPFYNCSQEKYASYVQEKVESSSPHILEKNEEGRPPTFEADYGFCKFDILSTFCESGVYGRSMIILRKNLSFKPFFEYIESLPKTYLRRYSGWMKAVLKALRDYINNVTGKSRAKVMHGQTYGDLFLEFVSLKYANKPNNRYVRLPYLASLCVNLNRVLSDFYGVDDICDYMKDNILSKFDDPMFAKVFELYCEGFKDNPDSSVRTIVNETEEILEESNIKKAEWDKKEEEKAAKKKKKDAKNKDSKKEKVIIKFLKEKPVFPSNTVFEDNEEERKKAERIIKDNCDEEKVNEDKAFFAMAYGDTIKAYPIGYSNNRKNVSTINEALGKAEHLHDYIKYNNPDSTVNYSFAIDLLDTNIMCIDVDGDPKAVELIEARAKELNMDIRKDVSPTDPSRVHYFFYCPLKDSTIQGRHIHSSNYAVDVFLPNKTCLIFKKNKVSYGTVLPDWRDFEALIKKFLNH